MSQQMWGGEREGHRMLTRPIVLAVLELHICLMGRQGEETPRHSPTLWTLHGNLENAGRAK